MKASELRIGNLILKHDGTTFLVTGHFIAEFETRDQEMLQTNPPKPFFSGIPLTEEWLLKFGFEQGRNRAGWVLLDDPLKGDYIDDNVLFEFFPSNHDHIKHVHQLQNLFFALTGEELTIK